MQEVDLGEVATDGREHELSLYMEDTGWPDAPLDDYIELWDHDYWQHMRLTPPDRKLLDIQACFQVAHGSGIRPEAILMQKVMNFSILGGLLTTKEEYHDARQLAGLLHDQGARAARPVGEQAPAHVQLVPPLVAKGSSASCRADLVADVPLAGHHAPKSERGGVAPVLHAPALVLGAGLRAGR